MVVVVVVVVVVDGMASSAEVEADVWGVGSAFSEATVPRHDLDWFLRRSEMGLESVELSI
jgi:hypothetical protein